nr:Sua5/YciO/YrdC/YwlC family protein [Cyanobium sp. LEGE 06113]
MLLHCRGTVQGVGFRPFVHRLASALELCGEVENVDGAVRVDLHGERPALERFLGRLSSELPVPARLEPVEPSWLPPLSQPPAGLRIAAAAPRPLGTGLIAPALVADRAPCKACLAELADPANRRYRYPFISCCACGPRYSIATATPFARAHTTLAAFPLCPACRREFSDPADRRFHAETIGCPACGPQLSLSLAASADREPIQAAAALLLAGGILALQGVGGFQLLVDASQPEAIARLRRLKRRPHKPLALLVHDPAALENCVQISPLERDLLHAPAAPIVLLRRADPLATEAWPGVAPGSAQLGVMLSASPLHQLLARAVGRPLVATSGNLSGDLLCTDPQEARQRLAGIADALLHHNRPIARPLDDSLVQVVEGRPRLLRRARGHAPAALVLPLAPPVDCRALALGGDLKNAAAEASGGHIRLAPHLGDLAGPRQHRVLEVWLQEPRAGPQPPQLIACDAHPGYVSQRLANDALISWNRQAAGPERVRLVPVQHHRAHGLAVAAEHGLPLPLLVWAWDGLATPPARAPATSSGAANCCGSTALTPRDLQLSGWRPCGPFPCPAVNGPCGSPVGWRWACWPLWRMGAGSTIRPRSAAARPLPKRSCPCCWRPCGPAARHPRPHRWGGSLTAWRRCWGRVSGRAMRARPACSWRDSPAAPRPSGGPRASGRPSPGGPAVRRCCRCCRPRTCPWAGWTGSPCCAICWSSAARGWMRRGCRWLCTRPWPMRWRLQRLRPRRQGRPWRWPGAASRTLCCWSSAPRPLAPRACGPSGVSRCPVTTAASPWASCGQFVSGLPRTEVALAARPCAWPQQD